VLHDLQQPEADGEKGEGSDERDAQADETALAVPPILEGARRQHCYHRLRLRLDRRLMR